MADKSKITVQRYAVVTISNGTTILVGIKDACDRYCARQNENYNEDRYRVIPWTEPQIKRQEQATIPVGLASRLAEELDMYWQSGRQELTDYDTDGGQHWPQNQSELVIIPEKSKDRVKKYLDKLNQEKIIEI
jgi:hypothetical protein